MGELARELLPSGGSILDVGCASGGLLATLGDHAGHRVGLELSPSAARAARAHADEVIVGSLDDDAVGPSRTDFDLVVCADVLEHLVDPDAGLARAASWVRPGGHVLVSVPNVAHVSARWRLLRGAFEYEESGIFDDTHLRFFTLDTAEDLVRRAGLAVTALDVVVPGLHNHVRGWGRLPPRAQRVAERRWQALARRNPNLWGYQVVVVGRRAGPASSSPAA